MAAADRAHVSRVLVASTPHLKPRSPKAPSEHRLFMLTIPLSVWHWVVHKFVAVFC